MKSYTIIALAALAAFTTAPASAEAQGTTAILDAYRAQEGGIASLTDAECISIVKYLQCAKAATLLATADSIEQEEKLSEGDFTRLSAAQPMNGMPADLCDFVKENCAIVCATQEKLSAINEELDELRQSDAINDEEKARPIIRKWRNVRDELEKATEALEQKYPRAAFLGEHVGSRYAQQALNDLLCESRKAQNFLALHPELKQGKRATTIAYLRHLAAEAQAEAAEHSARETVTKLDLVSRLSFDDDGMSCSRSLIVGMTEPCIFPDDRSSGYVWQLETPLPENSPVQMEWLTLPSDELKEMQKLGILPSHLDLPDSPETTIASFRALQEGKATLNFIFSKAGDEEPLLRMRVIVKIEAEED